MSRPNPAKRAEIRRKTLRGAAQMFLKKGYTATTARGLAAALDINVSAMVRAMGGKENILCELVQYVLEGQFSAAGRMLDGVTDDPILFYAAETALQLYMAESDEAVRDLYIAAYSLPGSSEIIRRAVAAKLEQIFGAQLPGLTSKDFYELEIASGGIIWGYMTAPCTPEFSVEDKVRRFLDASLRLYRVPEEKISEAISFVEQFEYAVIAKQTIAHLYEQL